MIYTNYVANPSFENDTATTGVTPTGWTDYLTSGSTTYKGPSTDFSVYGTKSWKVIAAAASDLGIKYTITGLVPGAIMYVSMDIKTSSDVTGFMCYVAADTAAGSGDVQGSGKGANFTGRVGFNKTVPATGTITVFLGAGSFFGGGGGTAWYDGISAVYTGGTINTRYIDGAQTATDYVYGWNGTAHASTSFEAARTRRIAQNLRPHPFSPGIAR